MSRAILTSHVYSFMLARLSVGAGKTPLCIKGGTILMSDLFCHWMIKACIYSFIQELLTDHLTCARHWTYSREQTWKSLPSKSFVWSSQLKKKKLKLFQIRIFQKCKSHFVFLKNVLTMNSIIDHLEPSLCISDYTVRAMPSGTVKGTTALTSLLKVAGSHRLFPFEFCLYLLYTSFPVSSKLSD